MPGQATVTINEDQWNVWVASTTTELTTGLSGVESIPEGTGMLFLLPAKQPVTVDTSGMLFPIDIIFISEAVDLAPDGINLVVDVASNIEPGYQVTEETPCDMFLEVNAGEAAGVEVGDAVTAEIIQPPRFDLSQIVSFAIPVAILGFVCTMVGGVASLMGGSSSPKREELPQVKKVTVECSICGDVIDIPEYDAVTRSEALRRHIEREHRGEKLLPETKTEVKFEAGEIVNFKGERVRVLEHIGDRVSIWVPSRQEEAWVKPESLKRIECEAKPKGTAVAVIPAEPRPPRPKDELEFVADSPEFLAYTIQDIGYRDKLDTTFQTAIARAKRVR